MKKVLDFLEAYVQWIALGLGVLFLGYCIWLYGLQTPVMVTLPGMAPMNPGDVDLTILNGVGHRLDVAMKDPTIPTMTVPHFVKDFQIALGMTDYKRTALAALWGGQTVVPPDVTNPTGPAHEAAPINALPTVAAATVLDTATGRSNLQLPAPAAPAGAAPAVAAAPEDKSWVTVRYSISPKQLASAFDAANIPPWTARTCFLQVTMSREELLASGQWSPPTPLTPINVSVLAPYPAATDPAAQMAFGDWAPPHWPDILQPQPLAVIRGDAWPVPGQTAIVAPIAPVAMPALDPSKTYPNDQLMQYSVEERRAYAQAREALRSQSKNTNSNRRAVANPNNPAAAPPAAPPNNGLPPEAGGSNVFTDPGANGQPGGAAAPPMAAAGPNGQPGQLAAGLPADKFDPHSITADIVGWQHDISVEPGHTYRYMITYKIRNPIFHTNAAKNKPQLANVFDISSPDSNWSTPLSIATSTNFFVASNSAPGATIARFKVFKWEAGAEREHDFDVAPGDVIGTKEPSGDFSTGWTLVALRFDDPKNQEQMTAMVMSPDGLVSQRDYRTDQAKPELQTLMGQAAQAASAAPTGSPPTGG